MTAEKHPLELVREALGNVLREVFGYVGDEPDIYADYDKAQALSGQVSQAITTLNTYLCQPQSCAECERLGRENARYKEAVRGLADRIETIRQCERPLMCADLEAGNKYILDAFAATIAAAGGE